jgi:hypothetical protein
MVPFANTIFEHFNLFEYGELNFWFQFFKQPEMAVA